jgi:hypothetical protein
VLKSIFISYRRSDTAGYAGRICDRLKMEFGDVFFDVSENTAGVVLPEFIAKRVEESDVLLALIGPDWNDGRRLDQRDDYVRLEIGTALDRNKVVIPLLFADAKMPRPEELPGNLQKLYLRGAIEFRDTLFDSSFNALVDQLNRMRAPEVRNMRELFLMLRDRGGHGLFFLLISAVSWATFGEIRDQIGSVARGYLTNLTPFALKLMSAGILIGLAGPVAYALARRAARSADWTARALFAAFFGGPIIDFIFVLAGGELSALVTSQSTMASLLATVFIFGTTALVPILLFLLVSRRTASS